MSVAIITNKYKRPAGYSVGVSPGLPEPLARPLPWNGYTNGANSPSAGHFGAVGVLGAVGGGPPTNGQTLQLSVGDRTFQFEYLYPPSLPSLGRIGITLPAGAASTQAQVATQTALILGAGSGVDSDGVTHIFPWQAAVGPATSVHIDLNVHGTINADILPAGLGFTVASSESAVVGVSTPASMGGRPATLPATL